MSTEERDDLDDIAERVIEVFASVYEPEDRWPMFPSLSRRRAT